MIFCYLTSTGVEGGGCGFGGMDAKESLFDGEQRKYWNYLLIFFKYCIKMLLIWFIVFFIFVWKGGTILNSEPKVNALPALP